MTNRSRPRRQFKADRLLCPDASANEMRCDMAVAPFDRACTEMDQKWGIDRLPELVSVTTAEKYGSAMAKLNAALQSADPDETAARAGVCIRGLAAMDTEAMAAGHKPMNPDVWEAEYNGRVFSIIRDIRDWQKVDLPNGRRVYSLREVAVALDALDRGVFEQIKDAIPEARIAAIKHDPRPFDADADVPF